MPSLYYLGAPINEILYALLIFTDFKVSFRLEVVVPHLVFYLFFLFIWGFYVIFNTVQVISRQVVL